MDNIEGKNHLNKYWYLFLFISLLIVIWLFSFNLYLEKNIESTKQKIIWYENSIKEKQSNKAVQAYTIINQNKTLLDELEKKSQINKFIYHLRELQNTYSISFKWFNYSNWIITTSVYVPFNSDMTAANRTAFFIKSYREDKNALFNLEFINTFNWYDSMTFNTNFKIK